MVDDDLETPSDPPHDPYDRFVSPAPRLRRTRRRRRKGGLARLALGAAAVVVTFALALTGIGFAYLGEGPISLESLQPSIAASLQSRLGPGFRVQLGPTAIARGPFGLGIGFSGLTIRDPQGRLVVNAPGGRIGLDALALLGFQVKVRRLQLDGLQLALKVGAKGELSLSAGGQDAAPIPLGPTPAGPAANNFGVLVAAIAEAMAGANQPLDHVAIVDGQLTVLTAGRAEPAVYKALHLTFDRAGEAATALLSAKGPSGQWTVAARAKAGPSPKIHVEADQLAVDDFLRLSPNPPRFSFDSPISFAFTASASPQGALTALDGDFTIGAGTFDPHDPDGGAPIAIDEATGKLALGEQGRYRLEKIEILAGATHVRFGGWAAPPQNADPLWRLHLHGDDIVFAAARAGEPDAKLDNVNFDAHFDPATKTFETDTFTASGPQLSGKFAAKLHLAAAGPELSLDLNGAGSLLRALRLWPTFINPDARKWCVDNVKGGELAAGSLKINWDAAAFAAVLAKQAPPADSVDGHFTLRDAAVDLLPGLPTATGIDATGIITGRHFEVAAERASMDLGSGRRIAGSQLSFVVPDTKPVPRMPAEGAGHMAGGADALAALLSLDALKRYVGVTLDPATIKGQFQGDLKLDLTLGKGVQPEDQKFNVAGALSGLAVDKFLGPTKLEQGALQFTSDPDGVHLSGTGQVFGAPAKLELTKVGQDIGSLVVTGSLDEAARAKLGFDSGPRLRGPVALKLKAPLDKSGADVEVDLGKAQLDSLGGPPWKPTGRPGKVSFSLKPGADGVQVNAIALDAGPLSARGVAVFSNAGALQSLKLAPLRLNGGDDLRLDLTGGKPQKLTLRGSSFDARGVVKGLTGSQAGHDASDLDLDVKLGSALGYGKERMTGLELLATRRNGAFASINAQARLDAGSFTAHSGDAGEIVIKSAEAGALARFLDVYDKMEGGTIELTVHSSGDVAQGQASIKHFAIRNEPSLHQLELSVPTHQNLPRGGPAMLGNDAGAPSNFDKLTASFTRTGGELQVRDGVVANSFFGLTVKGFINFDKDKMDLSGAYIPFYQFNNAFSGIPLLGPMLTGNANEGIFGVNYRVSGLASHPTLTINPLSPFAPGFLRKMFGAFDGTSSLPESSPATSYAPTTPNR